MSESVVVLAGGNAAEREVSLQSGAAVAEALAAAGFSTSLLDPAQPDWLLQLDPSVMVFNALHGPGGEDGVVQGALQSHGIPYTGSGVLGSALAMDKLRSKQLWRGMGLPTAAFGRLTASSNFDALIAEHGELFVKPNCEGSSIGMARVDSVAALAEAWQAAASFGTEVLWEAFIDGPEYTVAVLGDRSLPAIRLETDNRFYDYQAKYESDDTRYFCPCGLSDDDEKTLAFLSLAAFQSLGCAVWGRVDVMLDSNRQFQLLEVNTIPGMTSHSLVPMAARSAGLSMAELVAQVVALSKEVQR